MFKGVPSSPGIGIGTVFVPHENKIPLDFPGTDWSSEKDGEKVDKSKVVEAEMQRFSRGQKVAITHYESLIERVRKNIGEDEAEIFEGHLEILQGEDISEYVEETISNSGASAEQAAIDFTEATARDLEEMESSYFQQRAGDIRDIGRQLVEAIYYGSITIPGELPDESVVVAEELTPSATARLNVDKVVGIATEKGGRTSHAAILARSLSIPCVTGVKGLLDAVHSGMPIIVNGDEGTVDIDLTQEKLDATAKRIDAVHEQADRRRSWSLKKVSEWADGRKYNLFANISGAAEAVNARAIGAEGVGLFRTEFLFMRFPDFPSVDLQAEEYRAVCRAMAPSPVIVRLLDCGADKPLPYAWHQEEDNPFLGERGIRFLMNREKRLKAQIEAIARVYSEGCAIKIMIPMVISASEIEAVRSFVPRDASDLPVGIMVETPAAVLTIDSLARISDFISVGTNDLVQYLLTVDRGNPGVASYYQEFHPAVITALDRIVSGAHSAGIHVGVCGDTASYPDTALALMALGVDEISASVNAIPELKACFSCFTREDLYALGEKLRGSPNAESARSEVQDLIKDIPQAPWDSP